MARDVSDAAAIESRDELVAWIAAGEKPAEEWRIGTEHEKIPFFRADRAPVPYDGERGIRALLDGLAGLDGWEPIMEDDHPIGLSDPRGGGAISLEPGGQFELSGAPLSDLHETVRETADHLAKAKQVADGLGVGFLDLGMSPLWTRAETPTMPKARYRIMTAYMPTVGSLGLDMMYRTAKPVRDVLTETLALLRDDARALGCEGELDLCRWILAYGTSADRQLAVYTEAVGRGRPNRDALVAVVDALTAETAGERGTALRAA